MISEFENRESIVAVKNALREWFMSVLDGLSGAWDAFYSWLKTVPLPVSPSVLKLFGNNRANAVMFLAVLMYAAVINIAAFGMFAADKRRAEENGERIPERTLFKYMWLGGAPGALLAMFLFRHKTQHKSFTVTGSVLVTVQLLVLSFILGYLGFWTFF